MMGNKPFYKTPSFITATCLFFLFIFLFGNDFIPALRGWWSLLLILMRQKSAPFNVALIPSMIRMAMNTIIYAGVFLISIFVMAQFALPVYRLKDRIKAFSRMLFYMTPWRGPAVFVREGKLISRIGEEDNINPGVALVDLRSAIVLENDASSEEEHEEEELVKEPSKKKPLFTSQKISKKPAELEQAPPWVRIGGPGINFTDYGEKIRSIVDLRKQVRTEAGVKAFTRDGIEVLTNVFAVFTLSEPPDTIPVAYVGGRGKEHLFELKLTAGENATTTFEAKYKLDQDDAEEIHRFVELDYIETSAPADKISSMQSVRSPYVFDVQRVFAAAYGQTQRDITGQTTQWHELPQLIAAELFRNLLERYTYDYLYQFDNPDTNSKLPWAEEFKPELTRQLKYQGVLSYKLVRLASPRSLNMGRVSTWNEYPLDEDIFGHSVLTSDMEISSSKPLTAPKSLRERGIKVIAAGFSEMKVSPEMRSKMAERWRAHWDRDIAFNRAHQEREAMQIINSARTQTQRDSTFFLSNMLKQEPHSKEALALLLFQSLEAAATNEKGYKDFPPKEVLGMLQNLHRWLLIERQEMDTKKKKNKGDDHSHGGDAPSTPKPDGNP
jgi:hypothetical protein